ncbi:protein root initiation defective 3 [Tanacetum coccineum]
MPLNSSYTEPYATPWHGLMISKAFIETMTTPLPHVEVKSFPAELINPLACNSDTTYIVSGVSGSIYLWEVATGILLKMWHGHYRSITCLVFSMDQSLLIYGAEDGSVRVW